MATREERRANMKKLVDDKHEKEAMKLEREKETKVRRIPLYTLDIG